MRALAPVLLALLAACSGPMRPEDPKDSSIAHAAGPTSNEQSTMLKDKGVVATTDAAAAANARPASTISPLGLDTAQRREYADVYVDQKDPNGQKGLVYYLMKPDEWHIDKVVQLTPTTKHWRFWRVARTDGKSMPEIDPLRPHR